MAEQAEVRAADLRRCALEAREAANERSLEVSKLSDEERLLDVRLEECRAQVAHARESSLAQRAHITALLEKAAGEVLTLSKQQLEEVRSLTSPSPVLRRALGLLYCVLYPDKVLHVKHVEDIPWKQKLAPMLKRDDLVHRLANFASPQGVHPLLAYPAVAELIASNVCEAPQLAESPSGRKGSKKSIAAKHAAQLLRARTARSSDSFQPPSPSATGGIVRSSLVDGEAPVTRQSTRSISIASSLLDEDGRLTADAVDFASTAVGALFRWVLSQLRYARTLKEACGPDAEGQLAALNAELESLQGQEAEAKAAADAARRRTASAAYTAAEARSQAEAAERSAAEAAAEAEAARRREEAEAEAARRRREAAERRAAEQRATEEAEAARRRQQAVRPRERELEEEEPRLEEVLERGDVAVSHVDVEIRERITFGRGSAMMSSFATRAVQGVVRLMEGNSDIKICVEGHGRTDEPESLSSKRANAVLEELVKQGIPRHRLRVAGFGAALPDENGSSSGRVEFSVIQEITVKGTVQFSPCSPDLTYASRPLLEKVIALLAARPCLRVRIEGHTDSSPNWGCSNRELSQHRAENVAGFLTEEGGIEGERLVPVGFGETLPRASNGSCSGKSQNRRVEFHILQQETIRGLKDLVDGQQGQEHIDEHALRQLERTAVGAVVGLSRPIRTAAADLLVRLRAEWHVQRLLYLAARREDPAQCPIARLPEDCVLRILRMYFLLGCSSLSAAA